MDWIEKLAEAVHKAYCQYCIDVKGEEYWTKGDYSLLSEEVKEADRYTVRAVLAELVKRLEGKKKSQDDCNAIENLYSYNHGIRDAIALVKGEK